MSYTNLVAGQAKFTSVIAVLPLQGKRENFERCDLLAEESQWLYYASLAGVSSLASVGTAEFATRYLVHMTLNTSDVNAAVLRSSSC